jgi:hypothetical protein
MPSLRIRNAEAQREGSLKAVIDGYTMIPVFSYLPNSKWDDINQHGCNYVDQCIGNQITDPKYYIAEGREVLPIVGYRVGEAFNWSKEKIKNMNYLDFYLLSDAAVSEAFEGAPKRGNFSETDWWLIRNAQKVVLIKSFDKFARRIFASRHFDKPVLEITNKV